jgi:hypothetical protein
MKRLIIVLALTSTACATTDPGSGARMSYHLPRTDATVAMDLVLTSCSPEITVEADVKLLPVAGAQDATFEVRGADLASSHIKREFSLSVNADGVIEGINTSNEEQSPEIVGNLIGAAASLASVFAGLSRGASNPPRLECRPEVAAAVARRLWLVGRIAALREQLAANGAEQPQIVAEIRRLAREQGSLEETVLHSISFSDKIQLERGQSGGNVVVDSTDAAKWFKTTGLDDFAAGFDKLFGMTWTAVVSDSPAARTQPVPARQAGLDRCRFAIAVPAVREVEVEVKGTGAALPPSTGAKKTFPAAQFAEPANLCLGVGFGEARSVKLDFDPFGRTTSFGWTSSARAATLTGALSDHAADIATLYGTIEGPGRTAKQKTEIESLETQQRLNELRQCKAIIKAGGFDCKKTEKDD